MWGRVALWTLSFLAIPVIRYVWDQILEPPKYWAEFDPTFAKHFDSSEFKTFSTGKPWTPNYAYEKRQAILHQNFNALRAKLKGEK